MPRIKVVFQSTLALLVAGLLVIGVARGAPAEKPAGVPGYPRTIYLVRHGAYDTAGDADEHAGHGLIPLGVAEARLVGARLRGLPGNFDSLTSSTLTRARQTAQVIGEMFPQLTLRTDDLLSECEPHSVSAELDARVSAPELAAADAQLDRAFAKYFTPAADHERRDMLVAHGNVIRFLVMKALGVDPRAWSKMSIAHCSLTIIRVLPDGNCKVLAVGDAGHIPPNLLSGVGLGDPQLVVP